MKSENENLKPWLVNNNWHFVFLFCFSALLGLTLQLDGFSLQAYLLFVKKNTCSFILIFFTKYNNDRNKKIGTWPNDCWKKYPKEIRNFAFLTLKIEIFTQGETPAFYVNLI